MSDEPKSKGIDLNKLTPDERRGLDELREVTGASTYEEALDIAIRMALNELPTLKS